MEEAFRQKCTLYTFLQFSPFDMQGGRVSVCNKVSVCYLREFWGSCIWHGCPSHPPQKYFRIWPTDTFSEVQQCPVITLRTLRLINSSNHFSFDAGKKNFMCKSPPYSIQRSPFNQSLSALMQSIWGFKIRGSVPHAETRAKSCHSIGFLLLSTLAPVWLDRSDQLH